MIIRKKVFLVNKILSITLHQNVYLFMEQIIVKPISEQIVAALDGRTRRWLSIKSGIFESDLSKKMNGRLEWKDEELQKIEELLNFKIQK